MADLTFIGYTRPGAISSEVLAEFRDHESKLVRFNRASLETRLANLKAGGWDHDNTEDALARWPS